MNQDKLVASLQQIKLIADECLDAVRQQNKSRTSKKKSQQHDPQKAVQIDFSKPLRPFMKMYGKDLSGPKKFTLLLSWLAKGELKKEVELSEIERRWNRMTSLLDMKFNRFFPANAKDNDWVESKKKGKYNLRPAWRDVIKNKK